MKTKILFCLLITISVFSASAQSGAEWNAYKRANGIDPRWTYNAWVAAGMPRGGGGNNGGGYSGPSAEQIAEQQREQAARQQDKQGLTSFNQGDYETAISDFQKALQTFPNDPTIQKHLADAQQAQTDEKNFQTKKAAHDAAHDAEAAEQFQKTKNEAINELKGVSDVGNSDSDSGLKSLDDSSVGSSGLKDASADGGTELKGLDDEDASISKNGATNNIAGLKGFIFTPNHSATKGAITGKMDNIAGDTYFVKFSNNGDTPCRVYYTILDNGKAVEGMTSMVIQGHSSNANGPFHCSLGATVKVIKTEKT